MSLSAALNEVRDELLAGTDADTAIAEVAADNGLNAVLVARKFVESFGMSPADWQAARSKVSATQLKANAKAELKVLCREFNSAPSLATLKKAKAIAGTVGINLIVRGQYA